MTLSPNLLSILVCPRCKGNLEPGQGDASLNCAACKLRYPIRDGVPVMLVAEALPL